MPNNEEERRKLACVMCNHGCKNQIKDGDPDCQMCLLFADHVIKAGWKSPLEWNKCIDESAERVSKLMQSQGHSG
jgi:hypothetical protein